MGTPVVLRSLNPLLRQVVIGTFALHEAVSVISLAGIGSGEGTAFQTVTKHYREPTQTMARRPHVSVSCMDFIQGEGRLADPL